MRHFFHVEPLAMAVGRLPPGVQHSPSVALLVAPPSRAQTPAPGFQTATIRAVPMPPVTPRADVDRLATEIAYETAAVGAYRVHDRDGLDFFAATLDTGLARGSIPRPVRGTAVEYKSHRRPPGFSERFSHRERRPPLAQR